MSEEDKIKGEIQNIHHKNQISITFKMKGKK